MQRIVIIGAGVIGAAIAYHLRGRAQVCVIDRAGPGAGASSKGFGWINASFAETPDYFALRRAAIEAHRDLGLAATRWGGSLWWEEEGAAFDAQAGHLAALGYPVEILGRNAFAAREPEVAGPPERCLLAPAEGATDGAAFARDLLAASGATLIAGAAVTGLAEVKGRVSGVLTENGVLPADAVILAAGAATPGLLAPFGIDVPVVAKPGLILHTAPVPPVLRHLILAPDIHFRQDADGRIVAGEIFSGDGPGAARITEDPEGLAADVMARLVARLPGVPLRMERLMLGRRPVPADGMPLVGPVPGLPGAWIAVMHSGVTLAPIIGRLVADEVAGQGAAPLLAPFRPERLGVGRAAV